MHRIQPTGFVISCVLLVLIMATPVRAQDGTVKVYESAFNQLASRIQPVQLTGHYSWGCGFWGCVCDSDWTATITQLSFSITPAQLTLSGQVSAQWCGLSYSAPVNATGNVTYSQPQNAILITMNQTTISPCFPILLFFGAPVPVCVPVGINIAGMMNLPPIPVGFAQVRLESARGNEYLRLVPSNISLQKRNGYIELQSTVTLW